MIGFADSEINCGQAGPGVSSVCQCVPVGPTPGGSGETYLTWSRLVVRVFTTKAMNDDNFYFIILFHDMESDCGYLRAPQPRLRARRTARLRGARAASLHRSPSLSLASGPRSPPPPAPPSLGGPPQCSPGWTHLQSEEILQHTCRANTPRRCHETCVMLVSRIHCELGCGTASFPSQFTA